MLDQAVHGPRPYPPLPEASPDPNPTLTQTLDLTQGEGRYVARNRARSKILMWISSHRRMIRDVKVWFAIK